MDRTEHYESYVEILKEELIPAMGCTEPIAIALAAAKARQTRGEMPVACRVEVSGNIIKIVKAVTVPTPGGLKGIEAATAAGVVAGKADLMLEVLSQVTEEEIAAMAEFLRTSWTSAGRGKLTVTEIDPSHLHIPEVRCEEVRDTVSSLRLDAVASTGFRMARGKAADLVASGRVQLNWRVCTKPDKLLAEGDTVSARGFGKFQLSQVGGVTKKGRTAIVVKRYV